MWANPVLFQTLTGKEIEIDIEPTDKVKYDVQHTGVCFLYSVDPNSLFSVEMKVERIKERVEEKEGIPPQQQRLIYSGKQMWVSPSIAELLLAENFLPFSSLSTRLPCFLCFPRNDEKTAADYKIQGGSVLHLVLALRGGLLPHRPSIYPPSSSWAAATMGRATWVPLL